MKHVTPTPTNLREALLRSAVRTSVSSVPAAFCAAAILAGPLFAQSISVNVGAEQSASTVSEATKLTGAIPVAGNFWNNTTTASGTLGSLLDSTGAATTASVTWASQNTYFSASTGATATSENGDLTKGYLDDSGSGWTLDLVSPYLLNDIYVIHSTDQAAATMSAVRVNGSFYKGNGAGGTIAATAAESWTAVNWTNADTLTESSHFLKVLGQPAVSLAGLNSSPGRSALAGVQVVNAYAGTLAYWDANGAAAGSGDVADGDLNGTWGSSNFWSTSATGESATTGWTAGRAAVFSAGTDAIGTHTITVSGSQAADAVWLQEGVITLNGGIVNLSGGLGLVRADGTAELNVASQLNATNLTTAGNVFLKNAANSISGQVTVASGKTTLEVNQSWNQIAGGGNIELSGDNVLTVGANNASSSFPGSITGSGSIVKTGTGTLSLGGGSGDGGTLAINGGAVAFDGRLGSGTVARILTGTGALQFVGSGTTDSFAVTGTNSGFSGNVTIDDARVNVSFDDVLGTGPISVLSGGQLWASGGVVFPRNLTLTGTGPTEAAGQLGAVRIEGGSVLSGSIALQGQTRLTAWAGATGAITGAISGDASSILEKTGTGTLTIESTANTGFLGKTRVDGSGGNGTLQLASQTSLGTTPASATADSITLLNGGLLQGGTTAGGSNLTLDANRGITLSSGNGGFNTLDGFTTTVNGPVTGAGALTFAAGTGTTVLNGNVAVTGAVNVNAGTATFAGASVTGGSLVGNVATTNLAAASATFANMNLGAGTNNAHTVNQTSGSVTSTAQVLVGHWGGNTSVYNISGGSLNLPDTVTSPTAENQANLFLGIDGSGILNISGTGVVNTSSLVVNGRSEGHNTAGANPQACTLNLTGGRLNLGKWGMRTSGTTYAVNLGDGIVGASADWSSSLNMTLTGNTVINTLDSVNGTTPRTITLTGILSGTGGFDKQGAGTLMLNQAAGTFTGTAKVSGGDLNLVSGAAAAAGVQVATGGTLRVGSVASPGTATATSVDLNGGTAAFRIGTTGDLLTTTNLNLTAPSTITVTPSSAISGPFPVTLPIIDYTSLTGSLASLTLVPANPHLSGTLVNDTVNTQIGVQITAADSLVWKGNVNGNWNLNTTANWVLASNGTTASNFYGFDVVAFDDSGLAQPTVTLAGTIQPASTAVSNTTGTYTFQGTGIAAGSLTKSGAGSLVLLNDNTYTGATAISGGTLTVGNGGTTGTLGGSGGVTVEGGTLAFNRSDAVSFARAITGTGTFRKQGGGNFTTTAAATSLPANLVVETGTFTVANGAFSGNRMTGSGVATINAGATMVLSNAHAFGGDNNGMSEALNINGTLTLNAEQYITTMTLSGGTINGTSEMRVPTSSNYSVTGSAPSTISANVNNGFSNANWNVADVTGSAAADLTVSGIISNTFGLNKSGAGTMVLTGANTYSGATTISAGTLQIGAGGTAGAIGTGAITNNATLAFNRSDNAAVAGVISGTGSLVKSGAGILTLSGVNTYTGNTTVNAGTVQLADNAQLKFAPGANGVSNKLTGAGSVELLGDFAIDLTGANLTNGNSWTLVDVGTLTETYLSTFSLVGFTETANVHKLVDGDKTWTFTESTGVLSLSIGGGFSSWITGFGLAPADQVAGADPDGDGLSNDLEYALGGDPSVSEPSLRPSGQKVGNDYVYSFSRGDLAVTNGDAPLIVEYGTTLDGWTTVAVPAGDSVVSGVTFDVTDGSPKDTITATIPTSGSTKFFVRLRANLPVTP